MSESDATFPGLLPPPDVLPVPPCKMTGIDDIQLIGEEVAIRWQGGDEVFIRMDRLRALSPSAETQGERDLLGNAISGDEKGKDFTGVRVTGWNPVGGYGIQFHFTDGHKTGIYTFDYLKKLGVGS